MKDQLWELRSRRALPVAVPGVDGLDDGWSLRWDRCAVMGVVNVTPDSFSDGGTYLSADRAIVHGMRLAGQGAVVVDVGGESTRPGSTGVAAEVELDRVIPVVSALSRAGVALISIDTRKPEVAVAAVEAGAAIVNDIGGLRDPEMLRVCAELGVPVVVVHMQGTPSDMQVMPTYDDVVAEVTAWLDVQGRRALQGGVPSVLVDPGIGFGKNVQHNLALIRALPLTDRFPVLVGASRKRTIQILADLADDDNRDAGSIAVHLWAAQHGVAMVRVHDVAGHRQAMAVDAALRGR